MLKMEERTNASLQNAISILWRTGGLVTSVFQKGVQPSQGDFFLKKVLHEFLQQPSACFYENSLLEGDAAVFLRKILSTSLKNLVAAGHNG